MFYMGNKMFDFSISVSFGGKIKSCLEGDFVVSLALIDNNKGC